jgi:hypothetical protein
MWFTILKSEQSFTKLVWKNNNKLESKIIELLYEFFECTEEKEINVFLRIFSICSRMFKTNIGQSMM